MYASSTTTMTACAVRVINFCGETGIVMRFPKLEAKPSRKTATGKRKVSKIVRLSGAPGEIRTHDPMLRRHVLYPSELRARVGRSLGLKECLGAANALKSVFYPV